MTEESPIRIAGAGPAGLTAAIVLAKAGRRVEVHEARPTIAARFSGGFQLLDNYGSDEALQDSLARFGIRPEFLDEAVFEAELFDARLRRHIVRSRAPFGYLIKRGPGPGTYDASLLLQAEQAGAEISFSSRLEPSEAAIAATGPRHPDGVAMELVFETDSSDRTQVLFDARHAPAGYAYFFARGGQATFGCALVRDIKNIERHFDECLARFRVLGEFTIRRERRGSSYMTFAVAKSETAGKTRFAGEAGGFQDYLFGLGIRYAMETGAMAAESLLSGRSYDELWRARLGARRRCSLASRYLYETFGDAGLSLFVRRAARHDFRDYLRGWIRPSPGKQVLARWAAWRWKNRDGCAHGIADHWCRRRER